MLVFLPRAPALIPGAEKQCQGLGGKRTKRWAGSDSGRLEHEANKPPERVLFFTLHTYAGGSSLSSYSIYLILAQDPENTKTLKTFTRCCLLRYNLPTPDLLGPRRSKGRGGGAIKRTALCPEMRVYCYYFQSTLLNIRPFKRVITLYFCFLGRNIYILSHQRYASVNPSRTRPLLSLVGIV